MKTLNASYEVFMISFTCFWVVMLCLFLTNHWILFWVYVAIYLLLLKLKTFEQIPKVF